MESITLTPNERKDLTIGMKRERKPSRRLRMHIVHLAADGHRPTRIARVLYCSRTTVYAIVYRFVWEGQELSMTANGEVLRRWSTTRRRG